jgi:CheY-like chemotaxis protein
MANPERVLLIISFDGREMYREYFQHVGLPVEAVSRPEDVMEKLETLSPAVIVTDMVFTDSAFTGPSFMRAVRQQRWAETTSMLVVSGYVRESDKLEARQAGADRFLATPLLPDALVQEVRRALDAHAESRRVEWELPEGTLDRRRTERRRWHRRATDPKTN